MEKICVVVGRSRHKMLHYEIHEAARRGATFIEVRLDLLSRTPDLKFVLLNKPCELVATIRRISDGGRWTAGEDNRLMMLRQCIVGGFDWVDIETDIADKIPKFGSVKRIVSYHNMDRVPDDLEQIYERMCKQTADVLKLAVMARSPADNIRLLKLLRNAPRPTVAHCMGEVGFVSRILALKCGSPFVYAAFNRERPIAPGLPHFDEVKQLYHAERINTETRIFGLLGDPVAHSHSPLLHNALYREMDINAVYIPFRTPLGDLEYTLKAYDEVPVEGYSVTIPHKEAAVALAKTKDDIVERTGSVNTLARIDGGFAAFNTDYQAILDALIAHLPAQADGTPDTLAGKTVLVLGAGGVARSIAHGVTQAGAKVVIASRTFDRSVALAQEVEGKAVEFAARHGVKADILINGTPIGMHPYVDESPVHPSILTPELVVFDTVYNPETTMLVKDARARGCPTITGIEMFVRQAVLQFAHLTGVTPSHERMAELLRRAISPLRYSDEVEEDEEQKPDE